MGRVILPSPSKINLYLEVLGRRDDGYHEITSIAVLTELCDTVTLERRASGITIGVADPQVPSGPQNLCYRAADLLLRHCGIAAGINIRIEKRIPVAGGMGGGSSNAAATLWGLNLVYELGRSREELMCLGGELGSDVPLFFSQGAAFVKGRGGRGGEGDAAPSGCFNRLEDVVLQAYPAVAELKQRMVVLGASPALVSGSGSTVFGGMKDADMAERGGSPP